jgi:hypothetical protein
MSPPMPQSAVEQSKAQSSVKSQRNHKGIARNKRKLLSDMAYGLAIFARILHCLGWAVCSV